MQELLTASPDFARFWRENEVGDLTGGEKVLDLPGVGRVRFEMSALAVDGRPDLTVMAWTPGSAEDLARMRTLLAAAAG